jgi:hypothetical protein
MRMKILVRAQTCEHAENVGVCSGCYEGRKDPTFFPAFEEAMQRIAASKLADKEEERTNASDVARGVH